MFLYDVNIDLIQVYMLDHFNLICWLMFFSQNSYRLISFKTWHFQQTGWKEKITI